jgi:hypothetical protein
MTVKWPYFKLVLNFGVPPSNFSCTPRITGLPKTWGREREREMKIKIRGGGAGGDTCNARVGPTSAKWLLRN